MHVLFPYFSSKTGSPNLRIASCSVFLTLCVTCVACIREAAAPTAPSGPPAAGATIRYTAVGASDANGVGSSVPCFNEECPDGMGYVPVAARALRDRGYA